MKKILMLLILLLALPMAYADYPRIGGEDLSPKFVGNNSKFNSLLSGDTLNTYTLTNPSAAPLIDDFDLDGNLDIVVFDGTTIRIFDTEATLLATKFVSSLTKPMLYSNDLSGDGIPEILLSADGSTTIFMYNYNGTDINNVNNVSMSFGSVNEIEIQYSCNSKKECLALAAESKSLSGSGGNTNDIRAVVFNYTNVSNYLTIASYTKIGDYPKYCLSRFRTQPSADIDNDGIDEFVASAVLGKTSATTLYIYSLSVNSTFEPKLESTTTSGTIFNTNDGSAIDCRDDGQADTFTSPLVHNIDGVQSNGKEAVVAFMEDSDEYVMRSFEWTGSTYAALDDYPAVYQADGQLLSNVFLANAQPESDDIIDFCVLGNRFNDNTLNLLCANLQSYGTIQTIEYDFDMSDYYNITTEYDQLAIMAHSIQSDGTLHSGNDMSEILTSFGVFRLTDDNGAEITGDPFDMQLIWENPYQNAALIPIDLDAAGWDDIVGLTSTNLWIFNDGVENGQPDITGGQINPALYNTWKINTSLEIQVEITDPEGDLVSAKVVIYEGDTNEQSTNWQENFTSGTTFIFSDFDINETIGAGQLTIYYKDNKHTGNKSRTYPMSVGLNGIEYGDAITTLEADTSTSSDTTLNLSSVTTNQNNNSVKTAIDQVKDASGLNLGYTAIWLLIMGIAGFFFWTEGAASLKLTGSQAFGALALFEGILLLLGAHLGFISGTIVWAVVLIALAAVAYMMRDRIIGAMT